MTIPEIDAGRVKFKFPEGKEFYFGATRLRFTKPLFHGIEFSRVGWVFATIVERKNEKLIHSSDLNGPIIEDYAEWIIKENPDILILDGPMTYMLGYTLNLINFKRTLDNAIRIIKEADVKLIIYDHHLPREPRFRERTKEVWSLAKKLNKNIITAAEFLGKKPIVLLSEEITK
jgi:predicted metallo-beta-lactamase superfamily hydrolase